MSLKDLYNKYTVAEIGSSWEGSNELKYQVFTPFLTNLYQHKLVYYEKFFCVAIVRDIKITPDAVFITVEPYLKIYDKHKYHLRECPTEPWEFGSDWAGIGVVGDSFHVPYANWRIWPQPEIVKAVEECILKEDFQGAIDLTLETYNLNPNYDRFNSYEIRSRPS